MKDIFRKAMSIIPKQQVEVETFLDYVTNDDGLSTATYGAVITVTGSIQSVTQRVLDLYGLRSTLDAKTFYLPLEVFVPMNGGVARVGASRVTYDNVSYILIDDYNNWETYAGWIGVIGKREGT